MSHVRNTLLALVATALLLAPGASAQHPRVILVEEATNATCDPCADQNPRFEALLHDPALAHRVVPIVYHVHWPGPDTMYDRAPEMDRRIMDYYATSGVPVVFVNGMGYRSGTPGLGDGAPGDTVGLRRVLDSLAAATSPIAIDIRDTIIGDRLVIATTVSSAAPLGATLRVAVVERHHFYPYPSAGFNGEESFPWIARRMAPDPAGRALELDAGETMTAYDTVAIDPEWHAEDLYVVAFVQLDDTREVLQAATTREYLSIPENGSTGHRVAQPGGTSSITAAAFATRDGLYEVRIDRELPPGWTASVRVRDVPVETGDAVELSGGIEERVSVHVAPADSTPGRGTVRVILVGARGAIDSLEHRVYAGDIDIAVLAWHEPGRNDISDRVAGGLDDAGVRHAVIHPDDEGFFELREHELVIALVGDDTLDADRRDRLREYLNARGRLLISGSRIAQSLGDPEFDENGIPRDTAFLHNYLHATFVSPGSATLAVNGIRFDPIGDGIGMTLDGGHRPMGTPDVLGVRHNSLAALYYGSSRESVAALRYGRPEHRVVYFAHGFESVADTARRALLLGRSVEWLLGEELTVGVRDELSDGIATLDIVPNPARGAAVVTTTVERGARVRVFSMLGVAVVDRPLEPGAQRVALDLAAVPAGVYLVVVESDGGRRGARLVVE